MLKFYSNKLEVDPFVSLIERFFNTTLKPSKSFDFTDTLFSPETDIQENDNSYNIELSLPGFEKENIKINVEDNKLNISGELKRNDKIKSFKKIFSLPNDSDQENIGAEFKNGLLLITINKLKKETKNIAIN
jgi:HSP20 family protein